MPRASRFLGAAALLLSLLALPADAIDLRTVAECSDWGPAVFCNIGESALSPDGRCLAYTDGSTWPPWYEYWPQIVLEPVEAGACQPVSVAASSSNWHLSPAWSPEGTRLAFVSEGFDESKCGLWTMDVRDPESPSSLRQLVACNEIRHPAWSADGATIAYAGSGGIYAVPTTGGTSTLVITGGTDPTWGPEGQIGFVRDADLWIRDVDGAERQLTHTSETEREPAWSPQGGWIAYSSDRDGSWDVYIISVRGGTPVRLLANGASKSHPSWSSGADRLVFSSVVDGHASIWLATNLPDWTTPVTRKTWSAMKQLYRP